MTSPPAARQGLRPTPAEHDLELDTIARHLLEALSSGPDVHPCHRVNHARGVLLEGTFVAAGDAQAITSAALMGGRPANVLLRFSDSSGLPLIAQDDAGANPRGIAIRLTADDGSIAELVGHSANGFPAATPELFLSFLAALNRRETSPEGFDQHLAANAGARHFLAAIPPTPSSYAAQLYHLLHAYRFRAATGQLTIGRLRVEPDHQGRDALTPACPQPTDFLDQDIRARIATRPLHLALMLQVAEAGDDLEDITQPWPDERRRVPLGTIRLDRVVPDQNRQHELFFDPGILPSGIELVDDPIIAIRSRVYRLAFQRRNGERERSDRERPPPFPSAPSDSPRSSGIERE